MWESKDTICGISTARGRGGISVIRVSGSCAKDIVSRLCFFLPKDCKSHCIYYGFIRRFQSKEEIDEVLVSYFAQGRSFTGEQTLEISSHGGNFISQSIILELQKAGARAAQRGEFTYRSFMNGRIDLSQAEGILAMIESESHLASQLALKQLKGNLSDTFKKIEDQLIYILAHLEAHIDFSYEDIQCDSINDLMDRSVQLQSTLKKLLSTYKKGRQIKEGVEITIIGEPNVGKSRLFNAILGEDRAIVSKQEGTTRDYVEGKMLIEGVTYYLRDTAGLRDTQNEIELLGMEKSIKLARESDLVFLVLNLKESSNCHVENFISESPLEKLYFIFNKSDLISDYEHPFLLKKQLKNILQIKKTDNKEFVKKRSFLVSAIHYTGVGDMINALETFSLERYTEDSSIITQARHFELLNTAYDRLVQSIELLQEKASAEFVAFELQESLFSIQQILGRQYSDEVMDRVFKEFCLGK